MSQTTTVPKVPHTLIEDVMALLVGSLIVSFGVMLIKASGTLTGGTAGLAVLLHHVLGVRFGVVFFTLNLPFYYLAFKRMGLDFVIKTFCAIALVSLFSELHPQFIQLGDINPFYAAVMGNVAMGLGFIALFRHRSSLGGFNMLALYLQDRYGIRAGKVQMALDFTILIASLFLVSWPLLVASVIGAFALNLIILMNHRPNRYLA
ncbi:YitT family protein [Insolitispirillum peregrinum]|uniref:Uncharacterized membrane-anchored protein YitT, contains DUF161 and DUF2179 domains n=1 Tax=Insolitispirillum peregrinum TaxID=80876 RepID=A0A1N7KZ38_9PROT|nr:YitT family protein [Insolitispirillum peregrinum]SIS66879.1 Uncharacterized membrane-anchored protein YitT, contains DUF161 and DUF2179 domains [Insolitispirillum peregrinum]